VSTLLHRGQIGKPRFLPSQVLCFAMSSYGQESTTKQSMMLADSCPDVALLSIFQDFFQSEGPVSGCENLELISTLALRCCRACLNYWIYIAMSCHSSQRHTSCCVRKSIPSSYVHAKMSPCPRVSSIVISARFP